MGKYTTSVTLKDGRTLTGQEARDYGTKPTPAAAPSAGAPAPATSPGDSPSATGGYIARNPALGGASLNGKSSLPQMSEVAGMEAGLMRRATSYASSPSSDPSIGMLENDLRGVINGINADFSSRISDQTKQNNSDFAERNATNANFGLMGSPLGSAGLKSVSAEGRAAIDKLHGERLKMVADATSTIDQLKIQVTQARAAEAQTDMSNYLQILGQVQTAAEGSLSKIAASGLSYEDFTQHDGGQTYHKLADALGYDDAQMKAAFVANIPKQNIIGTTNVGTKAIFFTQDPVTGKISSNEVDTGMNLSPDQKPVFAPDGTMFLQDPKTGEWSIAKGTKEGQFAAYKSVPGSGQLIDPATGQPIGGGSGNIPQRLNNPMSLTLGAGTQQYVDQGLATAVSVVGDDGVTRQFLQFKDAATGFQVGQNFLFNSPVYASLTVDQALRKWSKDGNNPNGAYGAEVAKGVDPNAKIKDLPQDQRDIVTQGIAQREGFYAKDTGVNVSPNVKAIGDAIISGEQPPDLKGLYSLGGPVRAYLSTKGYDLSHASEDWTATQKYLATLNGPQQIRLRQAVSFAAESLTLVDQLNAQWTRSNFPALNKAQLAAAKSGALGPEAQKIATQLDSQISDLVSELATVYKGGNSSTDDSLALAAKQLSADWSAAQLTAAVQLVRKNLSIRQNSITSTGVGGIGDSKYTPGGQLPAGLQQKAESIGFDVQAAINAGYSIDDLTNYINSH